MATKQQPLNDFHLDIEMYFHVQRAEDKIRCPIVITATVIIVMMVDMRLLLFLLSLANEFSFSPPLPPPRASRNISHVFPAAPSCFDTSARELCGERRRGKDAEADLRLGLAGWLQTAPRLPPPVCLTLRCTQGHHWSAHWALCSCSLGQAFGEIDHSQVSADWATSTCLRASPRAPSLFLLITLVGLPPHRGQGTGRWERERGMETETERRGC